MHLIRLLLGALLVLASCVNFATAQTRQHSDEIALYESKLAEVKAELAASKSKKNPPTHSAALQSHYENYLIAYYNQDLKVREHQLRVFEWQVFSANVVLLLVACLILSGIAFSGFQLWKGRKARANPGGNMDVEISAQRVRVQSSVIGVVVLTISGLFLLLFAKEMYRIEMVPMAPQQQTHTGTKAP